ncbi:cbb3-type cytochrome c oxidase N-terminal domain-containing protein [Vulgatibacter incomptus]|uniref:Cytochrome c oxidase subunit CcoP n=1 Tax=Vulgatibacter incomptus TaxID=1391653 RepID=A0A0K1PHV6_9BACT|nr:cbb3-type cytochrome c oxidase N-terminal domain-containing protein [Vulgatibacter incomptus]AKU92986.1 Cytochrome c oxidase subunit CcoP [Vulgatibacter incomptus]
MSHITNEPADTGHDYDGIREYDNRLPNWWLATLFITIVFAFGYWMYYHVLGSGPLQMAEYHAEMDAASAKAATLAASRGEATDESLLAFSKDPAVTAAGAAVFGQSCSACHGASGEGGIGPNLTDDHWIHGGKPTEILKVIREGVAAKGMPSWGPMLGAEKTEQLAAFVVSLKGKNVPGKGPEGELVQD